jgi:alkyldihydroxyacetonephosphate synthase
MDFPLPKTAIQFLEERVGGGVRLPEPPLDRVLARMPPSRLPDHPLVDRSSEVRLRHARGQSLPDWVALRSGQIGAFPDGVARPVTREEVQALFQFAKNAGTVVIPYGGGTSVVGHINPVAGDRPVLTLDMGRLIRLLDLDPKSRIATFEAGAAGPEVESQLRARGYTLGHFPQSFEFSTLGGWVATRSSGQQSLYYGRIEQLFAGGTLETPEGPLELPTFPASSAGPDLREIVLGSEGRLGALTEVRVRVRPLPEREDFYGLFFPDWQSAADAARTAVQARIPLSMIRVSARAETETQLALAGHKWVVGFLERFLSWRGAGDARCMVIFGVTGTRPQAKGALRRARRLFKKAGGVYLGRSFGRKWKENRFRVPYLRNTLWEYGYAVDTLETATDWPNVEPLKTAIEHALHHSGSQEGHPVHVFTHLSHIYSQGASIYTTYLFPLAGTPEETVTRWKHMKDAASWAIVENRGTISHQHGVGQDHAPYLTAEKGTLGTRAIRAICRQFDPQGMMNPGKLVDG